MIAPPPPPRPALPQSALRREPWAASRTAAAPLPPPAQHLRVPIVHRGSLGTPCRGSHALPGCQTFCIEGHGRLPCHDALVAAPPLPGEAGGGGRSGARCVPSMPPRSGRCMRERLLPSAAVPADAAARAFPRGRDGGGEELPACSAGRAPAWIAGAGCRGGAAGMGRSGYAGAPRPCSPRRRNGACASACRHYGDRTCPPPAAPRPCPRSSRITCRPCTPARRGAHRPVPSGLAGRRAAERPRHADADPSGKGGRRWRARRPSSLPPLSCRSCPEPGRFVS